VISWHREKNERKVATGWHALAEDPFDGWTPKYLEMVISSRIWSPIKFKEGIRKESHYLVSIVAALDFDGPETPLSWAQETFRDYDATIGTTKSHQKEKNGITCDRYRVLLWFKEAIYDAATYKHNMGLLINKYRADKACKDAARFFFPCVDIVESHGGGTVDVVPLPVAVEKGLPRYTPTKRRGQYGAINATPATENRNQAVFTEGCRLFRTELDYSSIIDKLRIISNGLPENEFQRTIKRCQEYARK
jgi:hypothetical protein